MVRRYRLLGGLTIEDDGHLSPIMNYSKGCALLAYLIVTGQPQSREVMADFLWEAASSAQAFRNLRATLYKLRPLAPELVVSKSRLAFKGGDDIGIDFLQLQAALETQDSDALEAALPLYKGDLLDGFYLEDAPRFWEWLVLEREQLRQRVWEGYRHLCTAFNQQKAWQKGIETAQRWLALDELDEEIHRQLMQFLAAAGGIEAALAQYERCCQILWDELGVEPEEATRAIAAQISQLVLPVAGQVAGPGPLPAQSYMPYHRNMAFTGRATYLLQLAELLMPGTGSADLFTKSAVITGMGGLGKTQLAVEYAYRYGRFYPGGVYWISFAEADSVTAEIATIGGERGMKLFQRSDDLTLSEQAAKVQSAWQEPVARLLIFDNCEDEMLAVDWLPVTGGCSVIVTSRRGDWPLEMPLTELPLGTLSVMEGMAFLHQMAKRLTEQEAADITEEVGGLPLALQLAGHYLDRHNQVKPADYISQLRETALLAHDSLQGKFSRYSPTGHELHVARTFALSYDQLSPTDPIDEIAKEILARAAVFAPGNPVPESLLLSTILGKPDEFTKSLQAARGLERLIALGILKREGGETIVIHRLLALFTEMQVGVSQEAQTAVVQKVVELLKKTREEKGTLYFLPFSAVHLRYLTRQGLVDKDANSVELHHQMTTYLVNIRDFEAAMENAYRTLEVSKEFFGMDHLTTVRSLNTIGTIYFDKEEFPKALPIYEEVAAISERILPADHPQVASAYHNLGNTLGVYGDYEQSQIYMEKSLALDEARWDSDREKPPNILAHRLHSMGYLLMEIGKYEEAMPYLERALNIRNELHGADSPLSGMTVYHLGRLYLKLGHYEQAQDQIQRGHELIEKGYGSNHPLVSAPLDSLGVLYTKLGDYERANAYLEKALLVRVGSFIYKAETLINLGELHLTMGQKKLARDCFKRALDLLNGRVLPNHLWVQKAQIGLARI